MTLPSNSNSPSPSAGNKSCASTSSPASPRISLKSIPIDLVSVYDHSISMDIVKSEYLSSDVFASTSTVASPSALASNKSSNLLASAEKVTFLSSSEDNKFWMASTTLCKKRAESHALTPRTRKERDFGGGTDVSIFAFHEKFETNRMNTSITRSMSYQAIFQQRCFCQILLIQAIPHRNSGHCSLRDHLSKIPVQSRGHPIHHQN